MPVTEINALQASLTDKNRTPIIAVLQKSLEEAYEKAVKDLDHCNRQETDAIMRARYRAVKGLEDSQKKERQELNEEYAKKTREVSEQFGISGHFYDKHSHLTQDQRDVINAQLTQLREHNNETIKKLNEQQAVEFKQKQEEESSKLNFALHELSTQYKLVIDAMRTENQRIRQLVLNDAFYNRHINPGLQQLADAVSCFLEQHPWVEDDENNELIFDCFAYSRKNTPWAKWAESLKATIDNAGTAIWSNCEAKTLKGYAEHWAGEKVLEKNLVSYEKSLQQIETYKLSPSSIDPYMRQFLYDPNQIKKLFVDHQRKGIASLSFNKSINFSSNKAYPLILRRLDWLRLADKLISLMASQTNGKTSKSNLLPVLPLSLSEVERFKNESDVRVIILNVGTEDNPLCVLMQSQSNQWLAYVPEGSDYQRLKDQMTTTIGRQWPRTMGSVYFQSVSMAEHIDRQNAQNNTTEVTAWHAVIGARLLPFSLANLSGTTLTIDTYRHNVPIALLLESTLSCAVLNCHYGNAPTYYLPSTIGERYALRAFHTHIRPLSLQQAWELQPFPKVRSCFYFPSSWIEKNQLQTFLTAIDEGYINILSQKGNNPLGLSLSPHSANKKPYHQNQRVLTKYEFFYLMVMAYQQKVNTITLNNVNNSGWSSHWKDSESNVLPDLSRGLLVSASASHEKSVRHLLDSNVDITTVTPLSTGLPAVLRYTACCAARNRLMRNYFASSTILSDDVGNMLWNETGKQALKIATILAAFSEEALETFFDAVKQLTSGPDGWLKQGCIDQPIPTDDSKRLVWEFAQLAQMGLPGLDALFNQWRESTADLTSLPFDLNCQTTCPENHLERIVSYAKHNAHKLLPRINLYMPDDFTKPAAIAESCANLLAHLDTRNCDDQDREHNDLYLYNFTAQPIDDRINFLKRLFQDIQNKKIITLIKIPAFDQTVSVNDHKESQVQDLYRQIQNAILNHRRLTKAEEIKRNTEQLQIYAKNGRLPTIKALLEVKEDCVLLPSETDKPYQIAGNKSNGIQQQLQQAQQQQKQVTQQRQVELEQKIDVEEETQILDYQSKGQTLLTKDTIDNEHIKAYWQTLPQATQALSGYNATSNSPFKQLFCTWVGSEHDGMQVVKYIEQEAAEIILQHASAFRFGLFYDNLPPGFSIARKIGEKHLVLCFDSHRERNELQQLDSARNHGSLTPKQKTKMILHTPKAAEMMPGGDDRQFEAMTPDHSSDAVKPSYWRHLVAKSPTRPAVLTAGQSTMQENADSDHHLVMARVQASLQLAAFNTSRKPNAEDQQAVISFLQQWVSSLIPDENTMVNTLFAKDVHESTLFPVQTQSLLMAFGQIMHKYDSYPFNQGQHGSYQFMQLAHQIHKAFADNPNYFCIWRNRLLIPSENWTECLQKSEVDAVVESLRVLKDRPEHTEFWWHLVDKHGEITGHMQYAPLWATCYSLFQYLDTHKLQLSPIVVEEWQSFLQQNPINGQVLIERLLSVLRHTAKSAIEQQDAQQDQQLILDNLSHIDWRHDGEFYAKRYEGFRGYWDQELLFTQFKEASDARYPTYVPAFDAFDKTRDESQRIKQEVTAALRYSARHFAKDRLHYLSMKTLIQTHWLNNTIAAAIPTAHRIDALRLILISFIHGLDSSQNLSATEMETFLTLCQNPNITKVLSLLSQAHTLDDVATRALFWPMHFKHLPQFIQALASLNGVETITSSKTDLLKLIKQAEVALNCFDSTLFETMAKNAGHQFSAGWLNNWLTQLPSKPYLRAFPWLIIEALNSPDDKALIDLTKNGGAEYDRLMKQMHSINFPDCTALPALKTIQSDLPLTRTLSIWSIFVLQLTAPTRTTFIGKASASGCHIIDQGVGFRTLLDEEKTHVQDVFQRRMAKTAYFSINNPLFDKFIDRIAVPEMQSTEVIKSLEKTIELLLSIHNKVYYNELGQLLGLLVETVAPNGPRANDFYTLPQLHHWINCLTKSTGFQHQHYPVHLLKEVLHAPGDQTLMSPGLLKPYNRLDECRETAPKTSLVNNWMRLIESTLPNQYSGLIARLMLRSNDLNDFARSVQAVFEDKRCSPQLLDALYQLLQQPTVLDGTFLCTSVKSWFKYLSAEVKEGVDYDMYQQAILQLTNHLTQQATPARDLSGAVLPDWKMPTTALETLWEQLRRRSILSNTTADEALAQRKLIIIANATEGQFNNLAGVDALMARLDQSAMNCLIEFYSAGGSLSFPDLQRLLDKLYPSSRPISAEYMLKCLHHHEAVLKGLNADGTLKRVYSADPNALLRVISGFEKKGKGRSSDKEQQALINLFYYMNEYCQLSNLDQLHMDELQQALQTARKDLLNCQEPSSAEAQFASSRLLACMREVMLRRTGKWANHTQMLALLYAACHNDEGLIHQVRTGQGKSIISLMRATYLALTGHVVDVFSAKESLSQRDATDAEPFLKVCGIPFSYITPTSDMKSYRQQTAATDTNPPLGAVNFATIGNFSLFLSRNAWMDPQKVQLKAEHRVAFLDEADHILLDDQTQFNFPDPAVDRDAYNFDEWVLREIYQFYCGLRDNDTDFIETNTIYRQKHLDALSRRLIRLKHLIPEDSKFFETYLLPAMAIKGEMREQALQKRDDALVYLLRAAHAAHALEEGVEFCSGTDQRQLQGQVVQVRILQVMIDNQVQQGATYSDAVHQMACVRKNENAKNNGETPNYFIDPETKIVLSQNCQSILSKAIYCKMEGCTGTSGDTEALEHYKTVFNVDHVVKLPTHEVIRTEFKPSQYVADFDAQVEAIVNTITRYAPQQPLLVTCKDDIEVKRLFRAVSDIIKTRDQTINLIRDTNDSGQTEADIVPIAGQKKSVTFSSRMGRGTDIKPASDRGLYVLRTYLASTRVTKQEIGRQGRNGACGVSESIIDVNALQQEYNLYQSFPEGEEHLKRLEAYETQHLDAKIKKHQLKGSSKLDWLEGEDKAKTRQHYIRARACIQYRHQLHEEQHVKLRRQEALMAWMSSGIETYLRSASNDQIKLVKEAWKTCRATIENEWHTYLTEAKTPNTPNKRQQWHDFITKTSIAWERVVITIKNADTNCAKWLSQYSNIKLLETHQKELAHPVQKDLNERATKSLGTVPHLTEYIQCHQHWMEQAIFQRKSCLKRAAIDKEAVSKLMLEFDEENFHGLNHAFLQLRQLHEKPMTLSAIKDTDERRRLFTITINEIDQAMNSPLLFMIPSRAASDLLMKWFEMTNQRLEQLPAQASPEIIQTNLLLIQTLAQVCGAGAKADSKREFPDWLETKKRSCFDQNDPKRYANLLNLLTDMALTVGLSSWQTAFNTSDECIKRFLQHVGEALVNNYSQELLSTDRIERLRYLLVLSKTNQGIEALAKGFPTRHGVQTLINLMLQPDLKKGHSIAFKEYLENHCALFCQPDFACILPIITDLTLGEASPALNQLPSVDKFMHPTDKSTPFAQAFAALDNNAKRRFNQQFWLFLSQRRPLQLESINTLYHTIQTYCTMEQAQAVLNLPPYLSLEHIQNVVWHDEMDKPRFQAEQCKLLANASRAFNQWMTIEDFHRSADVYLDDSPSQNSRKARPWIQWFEHLPVEKSSILFSAMHNAHVPHELPETQIKQLQALIDKESVPLDAPKVQTHCQEIVMWLSLPEVWRTALEPCLAEWDSKTTPPSRLTFLTQLSTSCLNITSLFVDKLNTFPMHCYQAWEKDRLTANLQPLTALIRLYQLFLESSNPAITQVLMHALKGIMDLTSTGAAFVQDINHVTQWTQAFLQLTSNWQKSLKDTLIKQPFCDEDTTAQWSSFFTVVKKVSCNGSIMKSDLNQDLVVDLFNHWMHYPANELAEKTRGLIAALHVAENPGLDPQWKKYSLAPYLTKTTDDTLTDRVKCLTMREQTIQTFIDLPPKWQLVFTAQTSDILQDPSVKLIEQWHTFLQTIGSELPETLPHSIEQIQPLFIALWENNAKNHLPENVAQVRNGAIQIIKTLQLITDIPNTPKGTFVTTELAKKNTPEKIQLLNQFIGELPHDFPEASCRALWEGVSSGQLSLGSPHNDQKSCRQAVRLTQDALLAAKENTLDSWFSMDQNSAQRVQLMRGLYHGHISLGTTENTSCWKRFIKMIRDGLNAFPKYFNQRYHKQAIECLSRLNRGLNEIIQITQLRDEVKPESTPPETSADLVKRHQQAFKMMRSEYDSASWKNWDRRRQSSQLFKAVMNVDNKLTREHYYKSILNSILNTQESIIISDKKAFRQRNIKGYSRLYDLTTKLFVEVANDFLADTNADLPPLKLRATEIQNLLQRSSTLLETTRKQRQSVLKNNAVNHPALNYLNDAIQSLQNGQEPKLGGNP